LLVRPDLKEARQTHELDQVERVIDLDRDGVDEVVLSRWHTSTGETWGSHSLIQFDGWKPIILHSQEFNDNFGGLCSKSENGISCHSRVVTWTFTDLDQDHVVDLVETIVDTDGDEYDQPDRLTRTTKVNLYWFKDNKFVLVAPSWTPAKIPEQSRHKSGDDSSALARDNKSRSKQAR
jgi:hypothetical protein